jgi:FixJ family two-component response regulator
MANGGNRLSPEAILLARERERQVLQLFIRRLTFTEIAKQLGLADHTSTRRVFERAAKRIPKKDLELLRKLQSERLDAMRRRIFTELAGREK